ncbi:superoxide dismutase family protein [Flagellimonas allohymeniacidonis]|uniref:Superoxide dismutase family protein n=1 Tax=Flagellimonas allohymeniacidonis TaxID=2517819 RepID=A0A4Q8QFE8_9FLAO|nr:superoxide dismutase family protein [Allomuricauda hymeniacidonis]TAI49215.1 superoxide dismutase family protein [Allomuricauda hymeniacidonis]
MRKIIALPLALLLVMALSCKQAKKEVESAAEEVEETVEEVKEIAEVKTITFEMEPKSDSEVSGTVTFTEENGTVIMKANFSGLTPGEHAIHLHEKADCSSADGKSTGGHWNPTFQPHAKWGAEGGYHKGDIGNFVADTEGNATVDFATNEWCIGCDDETKNILGKAVIVHQGVDDFTSQPSGAAGARIACTGIIQ